MAISTETSSRLEGARVRCSDGTKLGTVVAVYYDNDTDRPQWVTVRSGLFSSHVSVVPLQDAEFDGSELRVPYDKEKLRSAPHHNPGDELSPKEEEDLFGYYGLLGYAAPIRE